MTKELKLTIGTHFFKVTKFSPRVRELMNEFLSPLIKFGFERIPGTSRTRRVPSAVFAFATLNRNEFRFHKNQLNDFLHKLKLNFIDDNLIEYEFLEIQESALLNCKIKPTWKARDYQQPVIDYLNSQTPISKLVGIQTGKGKGYVSMQSASDYGKRTMIIIRPMFIHKWVEDVSNYLDVDSAKSVMVIQGLTDLMVLFEQQRLGQLEDISVFILSNKTLQLWLKQYREHGEQIRELGYGITPEEMFSHLNIGLRIIDEVHLDFHLNFKIDLFTNVSKSISLSATLDNKDPFLRRMYEIAYPLHERYKEQEIDKYAIARCVEYLIRDNYKYKIKTTEFGSKNYSHNAFEEWLIKNLDKLKNYLRLIRHIVQYSYIDDYKKDEKCIIFAYKKEMCTYIVNYLKEAYPHLDIRRYVSEDPDENMYDPDIRVTTIGSGSTGHDISRLKTAIMTVNVDSLQSNIQAFGRLRKLDNLTPRFYYFTCLDIPKHVQYSNAKKELLQKRALNFNVIQSPFQI